jgi:hypothetical protein
MTTQGTKRKGRNTSVRGNSSSIHSAMGAIRPDPINSACVSSYSSQRDFPLNG